MSRLIKMKLLIYHAKQCDPKACTSTKLKKFGLAKVFYTPRRIPRNSIVLSPFAEKVLSREDERHLKGTLVALDCSWKRALEVFEGLKKPLKERILPLLIAANPVNYGKVSKLSTAEALSSALYILGYEEEARKVLSKFKWGPTFFDLNGELLEDYSRAKDSEEIIKVQKEWLKRWQGSRRRRRGYFT